MSRNLKMNYFFSILVFVCMLFLSGQVQAQTEAREEKSYHCELLKMNIQINKDATFDVSETITYNFDGDFHYISRDMSNKGLGKIDDIYIVDKETGEKLQKAVTLYNLDNIEYSSPGEYWIKENRITWAFDLKEKKTHSWIVHYKVHNGIPLFEYCRENDELYWDVLSGNKAEKIDKVEVFVKLPESQDMEKVTTELKTSANVENAANKALDDQTFYFSGENILPNSEFKIVAGWPKGMLDRNLASHLFSFIDWDKIISQIVMLMIVIIILIPIILREIKNWPQIEKIKWIKYRPHKDISYEDMSKHINDNMVTNKDLPENIAELAVKGFKEIDEFRKKQKELISEKTFLILFIIIVFIAFSLLALIKISPTCFAFFVTGILNSALTKFIITLFSVLLPIVVFVKMFSIWRKYGRDTKTGTIVPQYEPPKGITPAIADYIYHGRTTSKSFPSVILDMAIEGFIKMENIHEQHEKIDVLKFPKSVALAIFIVFTLIFFAFLEIEYFLTYLFLVVPFVACAFLFVKAKINESYNSGFSKDVELTYNKHNLTDKKLHPLAAFIIYVLFKDKRAVRIKELKMENEFGGRGINFQFNKGFMEIRKYLEIMPSHFRSEYYRGFMIYKNPEVFAHCIFSFFLFFLFLFLLAIPFMPFVSPLPDNPVGILFWCLNLILTNVFLLSLLVSLIIFIVFDYLIPTRTKEGTEIYKHLLGFKMYLEKAERFRVNECIPETFERYLPYAVIFGIEKRWKNRFSGIIDIEKNQGY